METGDPMLQPWGSRGARGRPSSAHSEQLSGASCCAVPRKGLEQSQGSLRAPLPPLPAPLGSLPVIWGSSSAPNSAHPLHPSPLHHFALPVLAQAASSSLGSQAQQGPSLPYSCDPKFSPISGVLPAQGFSWGCCRGGQQRQRVDC